MKIPVFKCRCDRCGESRVVALNGARAPEKCPVCGSPQTYRMNFLDAEYLCSDLIPLSAKEPKLMTKSMTKLVTKSESKSVLKLAPQSEVKPKEKRIMQVTAIAVLSLTPGTDAVGCYCQDDEGNSPVVCCMTSNELGQKDIRLGDWVEVEGKKILRVLKEKRGGGDAEKN